MNPCEETFLEVERLLQSHAYRVARICGEEQEELFGEASYLFMIAYREFDPKREVPFSRWLSYKVRNGLLRVAEMVLRRKGLLRRKDSELDEMEDHRSGFDFDQFLESLSEDAVETVVVTLEEDEASYFHRRQAVIRRLKRELEWTRERVDAAFEEVRKQLEG